MKGPVLRSALTTVVSLFGGLGVGLMAGSLVFHLIPGSSVENVKLGHAAIAAVPAVVGFLAGGGFWGVQMGRLAGSDQKKRMAWAGLLGFGPITAFLALGLGLVEPVLVARFAQIGQPIHRVFTFLFVPSAFLIAGVSAGAIGLGLKDRRLAGVLFWRVGLTAGGVFMAVNLAMETAGWVVGAPGAAARATMVTVLTLSNIGAALVGGGVMGWLLAVPSCTAPVPDYPLIDEGRHPTEASYPEIIWSAYINQSSVASSQLPEILTAAGERCWSSVHSRSS